jgi:hypothetical protein
MKAAQLEEISYAVQPKLYALRRNLLGSLSPAEERADGYEHLCLSMGRKGGAELPH